jgi:hypothetical protein
MEGRTFDGQVVLMAKSVYKISASMDMSMLDNDLAIRSSTGVGLRPLPIKFVFGWIFSALILFWMVVSGPVSDMGIVFKILFVILWIITSVVLLKMDKSKTLGMARIPILMGYMPRAARRVPCRTDDNAGPFATITNLKSIDETRAPSTSRTVTWGSPIASRERRASCCSPRTVTRFSTASTCSSAT